MQFESWKWLNQASAAEENGILSLEVPAHTDWYSNPVPVNGQMMPPDSNAPVLYQEISGDFVIRAKVTPHFAFKFDACALMVIQDERHWIKAAFEKSDFGPGCAICGVTDGLTDDANGWAIDQDDLWLQIARAGKVFAVHFSPDGETWYTLRVCAPDLADTLKVGLEAQCPTGAGGLRSFENVTLECRTVADIRAGK